MGLRGHPVAQAYERLAAAIFETAYLSAARIGRRPSDKLPGAAGVGQNARPNWCNGTERLMESLNPVSLKLRPRCSASIG